MDKEDFISTKSGHRIWYRIVGHGSAIPLLTLHGGPGAGHDYLEPLEHLSSERKLGRCGPSSASPTRWTRCGPH